MRAAIVVAPGRIEIADRPRPVPGQGEVLLRTIAAAICASDFHTLAGHADGQAAARPPSEVLGHEAVGVVTDSRAPGFRAGDLVLATPTVDVGRCFADYQCLPARYLVPLPTGPDPAHLLMAQQLGTVVYALKLFIPGDAPASAAVLGLGPAGLNFVQLLRHRGVSTIIGSDPCGWRRDAALELGATGLIDPEHEDPVAAIADRTGGQGVELAVEAAGRNVTRRQAMLAVALRGRVGLFGLPEDDDPDVSMPFERIFHRLATIHTVAGTQGEPGLASFAEARDLIVAGTMKAAALISHRYPLERLAEAFHAAQHLNPGVRKIVIEIAAPDA
jgi:threonine dehydrogenase-like Zn-dependent dehydrogenase